MSKLTAKNLSASYKTAGATKTVLNDVSLELNQGEFYCLCGANGCGKSTLLSILANVPNQNMKTAGNVFFDDVPSAKLKSVQRAKFLSYMQQSEFSVWDFSVNDFVLQGRFAHSNGGHYTAADQKIADEVLSRLNLLQFQTRTVHTLSGGEFQKVRIARALAQQPKFMLLDEPAANLDYVYEPHLMKLLKQISRENQIGILVTVHDINIAKRFADKILLLPSQKNLLIGAPDDIMTVENLKLTFGVDFQCQKIECFQSLQ